VLTTGADCRIDRCWILEHPDHQDQADDKVLTETSGSVECPEVHPEGKRTEHQTRIEGKRNTGHAEVQEHTMFIGSSDREQAADHLGQQEVVSVGNTVECWNIRKQWKCWIFRKV
jgi:hypothetical protein